MVRRTVAYPEGEFDPADIDARAARHRGVRIAFQVKEGLLGKKNLVQLDYEFPTSLDADEFMPEPP